MAASFEFVTKTKPAHEIILDKGKGKGAATFLNTDLGTRASEPLSPRTPVNILTSGLVCSFPKGVLWTLSLSWRNHIAHLASHCS